MLFALSVFFMFSSVLVKASTTPDSLFVYEGVLSLSSSREMPKTVQMIFTIKRGSCVVYKERHDAISIGDVGEFSVVVGRGARLDSALNTEEKIFAVTGNVKCDDNSEIAVNSIDQKLYISVDGVELDPPVEIVKVPYAVASKVAENSEKLEGKIAQDFLQVSSSTNQSVLDQWFQSTILADLLSGNYNASSSESAKTLSMTLPIEKGGTGATTASAAANAILPQQAGANGKYLTTDGSNLRWASLPASPTMTLSAQSPLAVTTMASGYHIGLPKAASGTSGYLDGADWANFNSKQAGSTALTDFSNITDIGFVQRLSGGGYTTTQASAGAMSNVLVLRDSSGVSNFNGLAIQGSATGVVLLKAPVASGNYSLTLPATAGAVGQILTAGASGSLKWVDESQFIKFDDLRISRSAKVDMTNTFSAAQLIQTGDGVSVPFTIKGAPSQSASLFNVQDSGGTTLYNLNPSGTPINTFDLTTKSYVDSFVNSFFNSSRTIAGNLKLEKTLVGSYTQLGSVATVDFSQSNLQSLEGGCKSIKLMNMASGGLYQIVVKPELGEVSETTCSFNAPKPTSGSYTIKSDPINLVKTPGKEILFSFSVMGDSVYVTSVDGY